MKHIVTLLMVSFSITLIAQNTDTLQTAQNFVYNGQYAEGILLLKKYEVTHPENSHAHIAHAIALFQLKQFDEAVILLKGYCKKYPSQTDALFQLGQIYYWLGNIEAAEKVLKRYIQTDKNNAEAYLILGTLDYWRMDYKAAEKHLELSDKLNPQKPDAKYLLMTIKDIKAPWLTTTLTTSQDTQPISQVGLALETGKFFSNLLNPSVKVHLISYTRDSGQGAAASVDVFNTFLFKKTKLTLGVGAFKLPFLNQVTPTASVFLNQKLIKNLSLEGKYERKPYLLSLQSLSVVEVPNNYEAAFNFQKPNSWQVRTGVMAQQFQDGNWLKTGYAWALSHPLSYKMFKVQLGYAVSYADSKFNTLTPLHDTAYIKAQFLLDTTVKGFYKNYFTPAQQLAHSAIAALEIKPSKVFSLTARYTYGFYAKAQNPYLSLKTDDRNALQTITNYYTERYTPTELNVAINYNFSSKASLNAYYQATSNLFYKVKAGYLSLKTIF